MATPVTMPVLGLTMEEGTVAEWLKHEGDAVQKDEPLLTVEMDKGTQEVGSPVAGVVRRIVVQAGTTVPVRTLIAEIGDASEVPSPPGEAPPAPPAPAEASTAPVRSTTAHPGQGAVASTTGGPGDLPARGPSGSEVAAVTAASQAAGGSHAGRLFASPRARMRARALGVDLLGLGGGSGPLGRIVEADVLAAAARTETRVMATPMARRLAQERGVSIAGLQGTGPRGRITQEDVLAASGAAEPVGGEAQAAADVLAERRSDGEVESAGQVRPLTRVRKITAERMAASARATASVTLFLEADFSEAARFRVQLQPEFARLGVAKLPWDALIAKAAALALVEHPALAAQWAAGQGLRQPDGLHVGVAVALEPEGLVVPVLEQAASRSLRELAADLLALVDRARAGRLSAAQMQGGAFTITNLGGHRIDGFTPILNPPETAILGVGRIAPKPVVVDGKVDVRTMCTLSLSFDHRVVDGATAAAFLARLAELLERPYTLLGI